MSLILPAGAAPAQQVKKDELSKHDRALIDQARAEGKSSVTVLIAAETGAEATVASGIQSLGGSVEVSDIDISYVRAEVPIDKAEAAVQLSGVQALDVDEIIPLYDPRPDGAAPATPQTPPSASTPKINGYMPIGDTGAAQFTNSNANWDGRGVTVGIMDTGIDLGHPALSTTTTGARKIVNWVTYTHPTDDADPTWLSMQTKVSGKTFTYNSVTYTAPSNASYRIALFNERDPNLGGEVGNDVNRDGNPAGSNGIFAVLWNTDTNKVYVDTNQNNSFADEKAMTDYAVNYDIGTFGTDNPATDIRESMPFVVQTDGKNKFVNIGIVSGAHGSHVAGIVAANGMFGGAMTGAAPGAKLVSVRVCLFVSGCTAHALVEGMTWLAKKGGVDVINMSIGGLPSLNDGNNARAELYDRLIEKYNVQMFISAGNSGPGLNTIGDPSVAGKVVSVGSYITKDTWQKNYGSDSEYADNLHYYSSTGPREDGGFKPNIIAPGSAVSTIPTWQPGGPAAGTYALPAGYAMFNGTSMAAPQAAGAAALLVGAAKKANIDLKTAQLRQAMISSTRLIDTNRYQVYEQGNGLINVPAAWNLIKANIKTTEITSSVAVNTLLSGLLATPGFGQGIHDREGVVLGQSYTRTYTFTRTKGQAGAITYNLSWVGNDGTFSGPSSVSLPLNTPVQVTVNVNPSSVGVHSAILNLDNAATVGIDYQTMNVVIVADQFSAANNYTVVKTGTVGRNQTLSYFFRVPTGTPALKVDFSGPSGAAGTGQARFLRWHPYGVGIDSNASTACYIPAAAAGCDGASRTTSNPQAGVWEVTVDARRTSDAANVPFTLSVSILGATISPNPDVINTAQANVGVSRSYTLTNQFGAFTGRAVGSNLGSAKVDRPSIANGATQEFQVTVDAGSTALSARIGNPSDANSDLDLFVLNSAGVVLGQSADGDSEEAVTVANPAAGTYTIRIDGYSVPSGNTAYDYLDVFQNTKFGTVAVTDADALRAAGASWTVPGVVTAKTAPAAGRILLGNVLVRSGSITIGSGEVRVLNVTP
ncbi:MAG: S8 family serine peptidase [Chloroflexi bacterium]|nr:S8 family serine peptidase [Chloroflexota bacterium]